jgi:hypothetical protein
MSIRKEGPGIEVFGGIDLNLSVGGTNPSAVEHMASITGGYERFVWMATFDSENQVRYRPLVASNDDDLALDGSKISALHTFKLVELLETLTLQKN